MTYGYQSALRGRNVLGIMENAQTLLASLQAERMDVRIDLWTFDIETTSS